MYKKILIVKICSLVILLAVLYSCASIPKGVKAVQHLDVNKYLGRWYEIARLDHSFEKNLSNTIAVYSIKPDGSISVENKGFNDKQNKWTSAVGKAHFVGSEQDGRLKVSFFGPFYGGYNVIWVDEYYQNALVYGGSTKYIWILSRKRKISEDLKAQLIKKARQDGVDTDKLIWVDQSKQMQDASH